MPQQATVSRVHRSWLAHHERQMLTWLAARLPASVTSDHLTLLGVAGSLICGAAYVACWRSPAMLWLTGAGLVLNWFGDSLDGSLARFRGLERPRYGFFVDHSLDLVSQMLIFFGLGLSPYMRFDIACLALLSYWLAALYTFIRAVATQTFQISYLGIGPTEIRLGLLGYSLALLLVKPFTVVTPVGPLSPIDAFVAVTFCVVVVMFVAGVYTESRRLSALEPLPPRGTLEALPPRGTLEALPPRGTLEALPPHAAERKPAR